MNLNRRKGRALMNDGGNEHPKVEMCVCVCVALQEAILR